LAGPVVLAELGWMAMGVADLIMVGQLGASAIGAAGIGNVLYFTVAIFGIGVLMGLDTLVSQAFGAGRIGLCHRSALQGVYLSLLLTPPLLVALALALRSLGSWGLQPDVVRQAVPFVNALNWSLLPLLLFFAVRRYLQAMELVRPVMFALIS